MWSVAFSSFKVCMSLQVNVWFTCMGHLFAFYRLVVLVHQSVKNQFM